MDTSRKYIEMCKVKEIQDVWNPEYGDFYNDKVKRYIENQRKEMV